MTRMGANGANGAKGLPIRDIRIFAGFAIHRRVVGEHE